MPSCAVEATRRPSRVKMLPRHRPRAPCALGESMTYKSQSSMRKSRWNHMAWSRLATGSLVLKKVRPCGFMAARNKPLSDA